MPNHDRRSTALRPLPPGFRVRPPAMADIASVVASINRCSLALTGANRLSAQVGTTVSRRQQYVGKDRRPAGGSDA